jgi:hypothetical protein
VAQAEAELERAVKGEGGRSLRSASESQRPGSGLRVRSRLSPATPRYGQAQLDDGLYSNLEEIQGLRSLGFGIASMPVAMATMDEVMKRHGTSPKALLLVTLAGAFFVDLANVMVTKLFLLFPVFALG